MKETNLYYLEVYTKEKIEQRRQEAAAERLVCIKRVNPITARGILRLAQVVLAKLTLQ